MSTIFKKIIDKYNIEWGGNWKMNDTPHFELK